MIKVHLEAWESPVGDTTIECSEIRDYGRTWVKRDDLPRLYADLPSCLNIDGRRVDAFEVIAIRNVYVIA